MLLPLIMVGAEGFEPPTLCSQTRFVVVLPSFTMYYFGMPRLPISTLFSW